MKVMLLTNLVSALISMLDEEKLREFAAWLLKFADDAVLGSKSKVDDALVLPVTDLIRRAFNLPKLE